MMALNYKDNLHSLVIGNQMPSLVAVAGFIQQQLTEARKRALCRGLLEATPFRKGYELSLSVCRSSMKSHMQKILPCQSQHHVLSSKRNWL